MIDLVCNDYRCLTLDCFGSCCDPIATVVALFPKTRVTTVVSKFARIFRDEYKNTVDVSVVGKNLT